MAIIVKYIAGRKFTKTDEGRNYTEYTRRAGGATVTVRLRRQGPNLITYQCPFFVRAASVITHEGVDRFIDACCVEHDDLAAHFERPAPRKASKARGMSKVGWACLGYVVGVAVGALTAAGEAAKKA